MSWSTNSKEDALFASGQTESRDLTSITLDEDFSCIGSHARSWDPDASSYTGGQHGPRDPRGQTKYKDCIPSSGF